MNEDIKQREEEIKQIYQRYDKTYTYFMQGYNAGEKAGFRSAVAICCAGAFLVLMLLVLILKS